MVLFAGILVVLLLILFLKESTKKEVGLHLDVKCWGTNSSESPKLEVVAAHLNQSSGFKYQP